MIAKIVEKNKIINHTYPFIGKHTQEGSIIFFDRPGSGMVIVPPEKHNIQKVGSYYCGYSMDEFLEFTGEVVLSNGEEE